MHTYNPLSDPRLNRQPSNFEMTDEAADSPSQSAVVLTKRVNELLERIAAKEADNTKLHREKTTTKEANRDLHS
jgi:hypothetical protein